jgi:photosystem II stability/assembly factor-like uncharacterized protein
MIRGKMSPSAPSACLAAAVAVAIVLSACTQSATRPRATATPAPTLNAPTVIATPTSSPSVSTAPAAVPYAPGFRPQSFTAISETNYWVLGDAGCGTRGCPRILHTVDGGATFRPIATPSASLADINDANSINAIRFANANDGWAFAPGLWSTHDGGAHWKNVRIAGVIWELEAAGGWVFATVGTCAPPYGMGCSGYRLERAPVGSDAWSDITPAGLGTQGPAFDLHQHSLFVLANDSGPDAGLWVSADSGVSFARYANPCVDLPGSPVAVSTSVVWAICSGGHFELPYLSLDGGRTFHTTTVEAVGANGSPLAATSAQRAYVGQVTSDLVMSQDGGRTFKTVLACPRDSSGARLQCDPVFLGFSDASVGYYIRTVQDISPTVPVIETQLWRTTDAGFSWKQIRFPS